MSLLTKRTTGGVATVGAAIFAVMGLATGPASALTGVVVSGAGTTTGNISASATNTSLKDNRSGATIVCATSSAKATVKNGTYTLTPPVIKIGTIDTVTWTTCKLSSLSFTVSAATPWNVNVTGVTDSTGKTPGSLTGITATLSGVCNATVAGTVTGFFQNGTAPKLVLNGGTLTVTSASGLCLGQIATGDSVTYGATYNILPATTNVLAT